MPSSMRTQVTAARGRVALESLVFAEYTRKNRRASMKIMLARDRAVDQILHTNRDLILLFHAYQRMPNRRKSLRFSVFS